MILYDEFEGGIAVSQTSLFTGVGEEIYAFDEMVEDIATDIEIQYSSLEDRVKAAHDYLVENTTYAHFAVVNELSDMDYNNAYAALADGNSVCLGYAQAFNLLLTKMDIESYVVVGDSDLDGEDDHAWNYVEFEEGFYHVDVTWDDTDREGVKSYEYFKISENEMEKMRGITSVIGFGGIENDEK